MDGNVAEPEEECGREEGGGGGEGASESELEVAVLAEQRKGHLGRPCRVWGVRYSA